MNRAEAIAIINTQLQSYDDEKVLEIADIVQSMEPNRSRRQLSARERQLLVDSNSDFAAGRTYTHEQLIAKLDARLAGRGVAPFKPSSK
jgi:hypothetical protein